MNRLFASLVAFVFAITLSSCAALKKVEWPKLLNCTSDAGQDLLDDATQILYQDGVNKHNIGDHAKDLMSNLAVDHGADVVACVVQRLIDTWTSPGAAAEPRRAAAADRARDFLQQVGTRVEVSSGGEQ